jgi:tRNA (guanine37-N1)-methyltransferase
VRIDILTIFPEFFSVLDVSLLGRARQSGLIEVLVHNLRDHTHDRHNTVDDTPYGGGAGMVMKPEPWGEALDEILAETAETAETIETAETVEAAETEDAGPLLIFPSPAGDLFTQKMARELAAEPHLVFGCGRYEGIDQRVFDHFASRGRVRLVSLGDYVLNGGEVAVMAMIEAVGRLIPGMVGNPESLVEESHEDGLLEYPSYTKPSSWRGLDVPPVLLSGNHGAVASWRREQQLERTRRVRPDLLPPANSERTTDAPG